VAPEASLASSNIGANFFAGLFIRQIRPIYAKKSDYQPNSDTTYMRTSHRERL
jgi:hypothetical protein